MATRKAILFPLAVAVLLFAGLRLPAQTDSAGQTVWQQLPLHRSSHGTPFPADSEGKDKVKSIEFRNYDQMTPEDRDVAADGQSSIAEKAGFAGLGFNEGQWAYRQIVCPAFPKHLFLQFTRNNGAGDVSMFSASIPRGGEGRVRIVPIQRRGYSLFSPAPINKLTILAFNRIRREEAATQPPDWLTMGLCYAALAGAHPVAAPEATDSLNTAGQQVGPAAQLRIPAGGGATIRFTDVAAPGRPMVWIMDFDGKGTLVKASHAPAAMVRVTGIDPAPVDLKGRPIDPAPVDLKGKPIGN